MAWQVSDAFLKTIAVGGRVVADLSMTAGGVTTPLSKISDCTVNLQEGNVRRTMSVSLIPNLEAGQRTDDLYDLISTELATFQLRIGFDWGSGQRETVYAFTGRATEGGSKQASGLVTLSAADYGADLAAVDCDPAIVQAETMTRRDAIKALIAYAFPGAVIEDTATDAGTLDSEQTWSGKVLDAINTLATDGGIDVSAGPDGKWRLRDMPTLGKPVRLLRMGDAGTIKGIDRKRPLDKLYNRVTVNPASTDGSQDWDSVTVDVTSIDPSSPRRAELAGPRVKVITSPTATEAEALSAATAELRRVIGRTETITTDIFLDPSLDLYDTVQIVGQREADGGITAVNHIIDGATFNVISRGEAAWSASISTRNTGE